MNSSFTVLRLWKKPISISTPFIVQLSMHGLRRNLQKRGRLSYPGSVTTLTTTCQNILSGLSAATTVCHLKGSHYRFHQTTIVSITSKPRSESTATLTVRWHSFMVPGNWQLITDKDRLLIPSKRLRTNNCAVRFFPYLIVRETGQFIC